MRHPPDRRSAHAYGQPFNMYTVLWSYSKHSKGRVLSLAGSGGCEKRKRVLHLAQPCRAVATDTNAVVNLTGSQDNNIGLTLCCNNCQPSGKSQIAHLETSGSSRSILYNEYSGTSPVNHFPRLGCRSFSLHGLQAALEVWLRTRAAG